MRESTDYFANHRHKLRFPWSLYHRPIVSALGAALGSSLGPEVLNVGSGPFFELGEIDATDRRITVCDIDPRAVALAQSLHGERLARGDVIRPDAPLPYADGAFDLVVSMDVIEHLPEPALAPWLGELRRVTKPGGLLFLTTPNYASKGLVLIEQTALELVARKNGFSRRDIHPSKFTPARLRDLLVGAGYREPDLVPISFGWVLSASARRPLG